MKFTKPMLVAGIAAAVVAGSVGAALASGPAMHTMTVKLPDGGTATVQYTGNVAPQITFGSDPVAAQFLGTDSPFADMQRISSQMNREMNALFQDTSVFSVPFGFADPNQLLNADFQNMPQGDVAYSMVSTMSGNASCMRSIEITSAGPGKAPRVVSRTSGDCGKAGATSGWHSAAPVNGPSSAHAFLPPAIASQRTQLQDASYRTEQ